MSNRTGYTLAILCFVLSACIVGAFNGSAETDQGSLSRAEPTQTSIPQPTWTPQPTATIDPFKARQDKIKEQFSFWDGSHTNLVAFVKERMHNPKSFEHVETTFADGGIDYGVIVTMRYRGTNTFGAIVTNNITARVDINGNIIEITE